ncbi:MAG: hypothetical protein QW540_07760 [Archaeoglobaceae archaeon]
MRYSYIEYVGKCEKCGSELTRNRKEEYYCPVCGTVMGYGQFLFGNGVSVSLKSVEKTDEVLEQIDHFGQVYGCSKAIREYARSLYFRTKKLIKSGKLEKINGKFGVYAEALAHLEIACTKFSTLSLLNSDVINQFVSNEKSRKCLLRKVRKRVRVLKSAFGLTLQRKELAENYVRDYAKSYGLNVKECLQKLDEIWSKGDKAVRKAKTIALAACYLAAAESMKIDNRFVQDFLKRVYK